MYLREFRHAQRRYISKVSSSGQFTGHLQTYISGPMKETTQSSI